MDATLPLANVVPAAEPKRDGAVRPSLLERLIAISRDSALEEMASGISHELNQPLGAIVTFAQAGERILSRPDASLASAREVFQLISKEALAAAEGIKHMRRLFHCDALSRTTCTIAEVLHELNGVIKLLTSDAGVALSVEIAAGLPRISIDRLRIQHVLCTLAQNALEASTAARKRGCEPRVCIGAVGDRYGVEISVSDNGDGIAAEHRALIFHPFFTTKAQGTGLGLASARAIVEAHEGTIGFEARCGEPTRFWFRLPAAEPTMARAREMNP